MDIENLSRTLQIDPNSEKSLQQQLADGLKRLIQSGTLREGDQMIPEMAICKALNVSRTTVRLAIGQLLEEGMIIRYRGKGTFVASRRMNRPINYLYNFTENIQPLGAVPSSRVLHAEVLTEVPDEVKRVLQLPVETSSVFFLSRIRCADGEAMLHEETYIPCSLCPGIAAEDFSATSLYYVLASKYALNLYRAAETIEAIVLSHEEAELLGCREKEPAFRIHRTAFLDTDLPFEYTVSTTRADKCIFELDLYRKGSPAHPVVSIQRNVTL